MERMRPETDDSWRKSANCATTDPEVMFPRPGDSLKMAKKICEMCEVQVQCEADLLQYPASEQHGFQAGMTATERRKIIKEMSS